MNKFNTLSGKILIILAISSLSALTCFGLFRYHANDFFAFLRSSHLISFNNKDFLKKFKKEAIQTPLHPKNNSELKKLINNHDDYTTITLYDTNDQFYTQGKEPSFLKDKNQKTIPLISQSFLTLQNDFEQDTYDLASYEPVHFQDGQANVMIVDLHAIPYSNFYFIFAILISILIFLSPTLFYIRKKVHYIHSLKEDLSIMAQGNLDHTITFQGKDELSILAKEMDSLRLSLDENIQKEKEARKANQELVTTLSHDLRTPLTSLRGYLDILSLKKYTSEEQFNRYLNTCIDKVEQIKDISNKTFDYAFIYESQEPFILEPIQAQELQDYILNQIDYLKLEGFQIQANLLFESCTIYIHLNQMKRALNNLFSNLLKYAEPNQPIRINVQCKNGFCTLRMENTIQNNVTTVDSHAIGLKSVQKVIERHKGSFSYVEEKNHFLVQFKIPY